MKRNICRLVCAALAFILFAIVPAALLAGIEPSWTVPSGYNAHDYNAIASFLEQTNASGKKNGEWLSSSYDPGDPGTWGGYRFTFTSGSQKRIAEIDLSNANGLVGSLDLSNCTSLTSCAVYSNKIEALNLRGCTALVTLYCYDNRLTEIDVSTNTSLGYFNCSRNRLTEVDVSANTALVLFNCGNNDIGAVDISANTQLATFNCSNTKITSIDISHNTAIKNFWCAGNELSYIDMSNNSRLLINGLHAEGSGTVGCELLSVVSTNTLYAVPSSGAEFLGWYNANGQLLSSDEVYKIYSGAPAEIYAHFTEVERLLGDVDLNGAIEALDALLLLRYAMNGTGFTAEQLAVADVDGDGSVGSVDALLVLRMALSV